MAGLPVASGDGLKKLTALGGEDGKSASVVTWQGNRKGCRILTGIL